MLLKDFLGMAMESLNDSLEDNLKSLIGGFEETSTIIFSSWLSCTVVVKVFLLLPLTARVRE